MRTFNDSTGREWIASAREEDTPRHHGRWYLTFRPADGEGGVEYAMGEVRWKTRETAERTILTMSELELQRRLRTVLLRAPRAESDSTAA